MSTDTEQDISIDRSIGDFRYDVDYAFDAGTGLSERTIDYISDVKGDPDWIREFRKDAYRRFVEKPMPTHWASQILTASISQDPLLPPKAGRSALGRRARYKRRLSTRHPEQERKFLAGVEAQFDSEAAYSNIKEAVSKQGVIFMSSTEALMEHPEIFRKWFGKVIPTGDNKFSALNSAVFSGGSFIYIPPGVKVSHPLQAYFRINAENFGQFERTLIIADEGSEVVYMEGCTAPKFSTSTLHSAVVELVALKGAKISTSPCRTGRRMFSTCDQARTAHAGRGEVDDCNIGSRRQRSGVVLGAAKRVAK
jgi:Fe-S cluster assembly protein SufB